LSGNWYAAPDCNQSVCPAVGAEGHCFPHLKGPSGLGAQSAAFSGLARGMAPTFGVVRPGSDGVPMSSGSSVSVPVAAITAPKLSRSLLKLTPHNGLGSLETFLAKFDRMAEYLQWNASDKFYHLCASLEGSAGQVLWDAGPNATADGIISLLRTRFGNQLQAERFRAELRMRKRRPGEMLQQLYV